MRYKILLMGSGLPIIQASKILSRKFDIHGVIKDFEKFNTDTAELNTLMKSYNFGKIFLSEFEKINPDLIFVINYNKIIDVNLFKNRLIINLHMGILPKYRGNNANAWAILNDEKNVGYTIHRVEEQLDAGEIFYRFNYEIQEGETYSNAKKALINDMEENLNQVLISIIEGDLEPVSQVDSNFIYCSKLIPEDGFILNWNIQTNDIINRFIVFAKPLGTGLKFFKGDKIYEIIKLSTIKNFTVSKGIPGAVVMKTKKGSVWIKTRDTAISIDQILFENTKISPVDILKIGDRL